MESEEQKEPGGFTTWYFKRAWIWVLLALVGVFFTRNGGREIGYTLLAPFALLGLMISWMGAGFLGALVLSWFQIGENWERERQDLWITVCPTVGIASLVGGAALIWWVCGAGPW